MSGAVIRPAELADAAEMAQLCGQLGYPATAAEVERRLRVLAADGAHGVFVAQLGEAVVGWIHVSGVDSLEAAAWAEIRGLVVDESCRGQGIGRLLVVAAETWASRRGYPVVRVRSNVVRSRAHHFYEELGYEVLKTQAVFLKRLGD